MDVNIINRQALAQAYYEIERLSKNNKEKIPAEITNNIYNNMDKEYEYNGELLLEAQELIYAILLKYVLTEEKKEKIKEYYKFYDKKIEESKIGKYKIEFSDKKIESKNENMQLEVIEKTNILKKIISKIKNFFNK